MSSARDNGGPAFPAEEWLDSEDPRCVNPVRHLGMTLRDYFAAKAMQGDWATQGPDCGWFMDAATDSALEERAVIYFRMANAMLKAREA